MVPHVGFGAAPIFAIFVLVCLFLFSFISLILYQKNKRQAIANMWLSVASLFLTYLIVDLGMGFFFIPRLSSLLIPDQFVHHKIPPNTYIKIENSEFNYIQRSNNVGLRGPDIQLTEKPGAYRILMLGDSFTMGEGVNDDLTFSALLEESLNGKNGTINGKNFEVLNAGVDSYCPILSFIQLTKIAPTLEPDLVVLNLDMTDLIQEIAYRNVATFGPDGDITGVVGRKYFSPNTLVRKLADNYLYMTRLIIAYLDKWTHESNKITIRNTVILANREILAHTLSGDKTDRGEQWQNIFNSIMKIKRYCDDDNINFLLTIYPIGHQVNEREWVTGRSLFIPEGSLISDKSVHVIEDFAVANNIELLNVFPAFRSYKGAAPLYFSYNMHWTATGHKMMARELERFIEATYLHDSN